MGGAIAALGLSQKAVYADDERPAPGDGGAFAYANGSDLAPNPAPSACAGVDDPMLSTLLESAQLRGPDVAPRFALLNMQIRTTAASSHTFAALALTRRRPLPVLHQTI